MHRFILIATLAFAGCTDGGPAPTEAGDAADARFLVDGKADGVGLRPCLLAAVLRLVNEVGGTDALKAYGVHTRAAKGITAFRAGLDGQLGTADDRSIADLETLDGVRYVGPVALRQIVKAAGTCAEPSVEVIFSPQAYEDSHLARMATLIDGTTDSLDIAMYSYRDGALYDAVARAVERGVRVRVVYEGANRDRRDPEGTRSARLEDLGADVRYINVIMHHKFAIFDGPQDDLDAARAARLATSSGNWSYSAGTRFDENTLVFANVPEMALRYQAEFNHMWQNSRPLDWNPDLEFYTTATVTQDDAAAFDEPGLDAVFTSDNFEIFHNRFGPGFRTVRGANTVSDRLVALIAGAETSVHVASGHLRSRPISEALEALAIARPEVDIRIYLDGQEYLSAYRHDRQNEALEVCLSEAGESARRRADCLDKGYYFSYALHLAGVPVRFKYYAYRWDYTYADQMHHKYLVVDGRWVATGSYNYSDNAEHNTLENVVVLDGERFPAVAAAYEANFEALWATGAADDAYADLLERVESGSEDVPLIFGAISLDWDEVTALKRALREACPAVDSEDFRRTPGAHRTCPR